MAKATNTSLSFTDIVLRAEADVIKQAYEARVKIDALLEERAKAYELIAQLEEQVDDVLGDAGTFPFPEPPVPIAGFSAKGGTANRPKPAKKSAPKAASTPSTPKPAAPTLIDAPAPASEAETTPDTTADKTDGEPKKDDA